jgi:O-antigen ligase
MKYMKQLFDIHSNLSLYLLLGFLFLVNFSIAGCYVLFTLLILQVIVSYAVFLVKRKTQKDLPPPFQSPELPKYFKYFLLYILFSFISTLFSINRTVSLKGNKEFFIYLLIPLFLLLIDSKKRLECSMRIVLMSSVLSALVGIATVIYQRGPSLDHRIKGFLSHWMTYSGLLMLAFIFFFVYLFYEKNIKRKVILSICLLIMLVTIPLTMTRNIWVGIVVSLGIFIVYYKPRILYFAIPAVIILAILLPGSVKNRFISVIDPNDPSNKDRLYMVSIAGKIFKDYPLTGVGPNNVKNVYDRYKPAEAQQTNMHLHNNFLQALAERGIFAALCLLAAFISIIYQLIKRIKNTTDMEKTIATGVLFAFIGFVVAGLFEYNYGDSEVRFLLYYLLSIPFLKIQKENENTI